MAMARTMQAEPPRPLTRRRFIRVSAMMAASAVTQPAWGAPLQPIVWRGRAMGTDAQITLYHADSGFAGKLLEDCQALISDLESQLSLYQPDSALSRLNRDGALHQAPLPLLEILHLAHDIHLRTDGAFDVTVQPLWRLYLDHFAQADADSSGPPVREIQAARRNVDGRAIRIAGSRVSFGRPGMAVTLNGVAQGYITDAVARLLSNAGMGHVLLDLGEYRALGPHPSGRDWRIGLRDPQHPLQLMHRVKLNKGAIATSGGYGTQFDLSGRFHHLFDPASGLPARHYRSVSIIGPDAARADALSTGLSALPLPRAKMALDSFGPDWGGYFITNDGGAHRHHWPA